MTTKYPLHNDRHGWNRIRLKYLPTDAPLNILTNAVAMHVAQTLRWSIQFTDSYHSGYVELVDYNERFVGRVWLASRRSSSEDPYRRRRCDGTGVLDIFGVDPLETCALLNEETSKDPLQILTTRGKRVKAKDLIFKVEREDRYRDGRDAPADRWNQSLQQENENKALRDRNSNLGRDGRKPLSTFSSNRAEYAGRHPTFAPKDEVRVHWGASSRGLESIDEHM